MDGETVFETERLILRHWRDDDLEPLVRMSMDERVMEFFPSVQDRKTCEDTMAWVRDNVAQHGFGFWVAEQKGGAPFICFVGLAVPSFDLDFTPCVEVGWRLAFEHWGHGYATEAARASLAFGFENKELTEIVAYCVHNNMRSRAVMERIGMAYDAEADFDHPRLDPASPLRRHVLYRIRCNHDP